MLSVHSETKKLRQALVRAPSSFTIREAINPTQAHFFAAEPPQQAKLISEHRNFCDLLQERGVELVDLTPSGVCPYEVFARDIGFVVNDWFVPANMAKPIRSREMAALLELIALKGWPTRHLEQRPIEGGDIIVDGAAAYIGIGERTAWAAFHELQSMFAKEIFMVPIVLGDDVLHLDCVFNVLPKQIILCHPPSLKNGLPAELRHRQIVSITDDEVFSMGCNVLSVDETTVIVQPRHERLIKLLQGLGLEVIQLDLTETTKLGGGFRCMVMPLLRGKLYQQEFNRKPEGKI